MTNLKHIDNVDFAKNNHTTSGNIDVATLIRACDLFDELNGNVNYTLTGFVNENNLPTLKVTICGKIHTLCQTCLEKIEIHLDVQSSIPIFYTEADLDNALFGKDSIYDDGILADSNFEINNFIEDEIIMLLPTAPKHDQCIEVKHKDNENHPFAGLKQLL
jgi:uncharacterized protein